MKLKNKKQYSELRKQIGTQDKVSNDLGIDRCTLSRRENGKQPLTNEACLALVGLYYLTTGKDKTV